MTNSMHRQGSLDSLRHDYVIFTTTASGINKMGSGPAKRAFANICLDHGPVNFGSHDYVPETASVLEQFLRDRRRAEWYTENGEATKKLMDAWRAEADLINDNSGPHAVFGDIERLADVVQAVHDANLGISVNITGLHDEVDRVLRQAGIVRHTIEHSLGFHGKVERLPEPEIVEISTMCGHGMVSFNLVRRMLDLVKRGRITRMRAAEHLARPCTCDIFNTVRAAELLDEARRGSHH